MTYGMHSYGSDAADASATCMRDVRITAISRESVNLVHAFATKDKVVQHVLIATTMHKIDMPWI